MFHLLPEKEKKILEREYRYRLILVGLSFLVGTLVIASVFLFPSYILSKRRLDDANLRNNGEKQTINAKTDPSLSSFLLTLKSDLASLKPTDAVASSSSFFIKKITDTKTDGISIHEFNIDNDNAHSIFVGGSADTRDHLTRLSRDLEAISDFSSVDLPISDFTKDKNINFSITITLKPNGK